MSYALSCPLSGSSERYKNPPRPIRYREQPKEQAGMKDASLGSGLRVFAPAIDLSEVKKTMDVGIWYSYAMERARN